VKTTTMTTIGGSNRRHKGNIMDSQNHTQRKTDGHGQPKCLMSSAPTGSKSIKRKTKKQKKIFKT